MAPAVAVESPRKNGSPDAAPGPSPSVPSVFPHAVERALNDLQSRWALHVSAFTGTEQERSDLSRGIGNALAGLRRELELAFTDFHDGSKNVRQTRREINKDRDAIADGLERLNFGTDLARDLAVQSLKEVIRAVLKEVKAETATRKPRGRESVSSHSANGRSTHTTEDTSHHNGLGAEQRQNSNGAATGVKPSAQQSQQSRDHSTTSPVQDADYTVSTPSHHPALASRQVPLLANSYFPPPVFNDQPNWNIHAPQAKPAPAPAPAPVPSMTDLISQARSAFAVDPMLDPKYKGALAVHVYNESERGSSKPARTEVKVAPDGKTSYFEIFRNQAPGQGHRQGFSRMRIEANSSGQVRVLLHENVYVIPGTNHVGAVEDRPTIVGLVDTTKQDWEQALPKILDAFAKDTIPAADTITKYPDNGLVARMCEHTEIEKISGVAIGKAKGILESAARAEERCSRKLFTNETNQPEQMADNGKLHKLNIANAHAAFACVNVDVTDVTVEAGGVLEITAAQRLTIKNLRVKKGGTVIIHGADAGSSIDGLIVDKGATLVGTFRGTIEKSCQIHGDARLMDLSAATFGRPAAAAAPGTKVNMTSAELRKSFKNMLFVDERMPKDIFKDISRNLTDDEVKKADARMGRITSDELIKRLDSLSNNFVRTELTPAGLEVTVGKDPAKKTFIVAQVADSRYEVTLKEGQGEAAKLTAIAALKRILDEATLQAAKSAAGQAPTNQKNKEEGAAPVAATTFRTVA